MQPSRFRNSGRSTLLRVVGKITMVYMDVILMFTSWTDHRVSMRFATGFDIRNVIEAI